MSALITIAALAAAKKLPVKYLRELGLRDVAAGVAIPYHGSDGKAVFERTRLSLKGDRRFQQPAGVPLQPYGLNRIDEARKAEYLLVVEGESDCWASWYHNFSALGLPGSGAANTLQREHVAGIPKIFALKEPGSAGEAFIRGITRRLLEIGFEGEAYAFTTSSVKDLADLHVEHAHDPEAFKAVLHDALNHSDALSLSALDMRTSSVWKQAKSIDEFLKATEPDTNYLIPNIVARESITLVASPRGLGKTHVAYWWAISLARSGYRVLVIDRDNPKREIRRRLKAWGANELADNFKIIARDLAPPLTDKRAWAEFPYSDYDVVILDSISAATEGVEEKDGGKAGAGLAPLLDAARRGPAVLVLANTTKDGLSVRGSGTLSDRADIVFELRDATDLKVDSKHEAWWDALPDSGANTWGERAKRRRRRDRYRLALIPSKFRLGEEPNPMCFEIHHDADPWTVTDVTAELEDTLEAAKRAAADAAQATIDIAVKALIAKLPLKKHPDAIDLLIDCRLSRTSARRLVDDRVGRDWIITGAGTKTDPYYLDLPAGISRNLASSKPESIDSTIPADTGVQERQESTRHNGSAPRVLQTVDSCRSAPDVNAGRDDRLRAFDANGNEIEVYEDLDEDPDEPA